MTSTDPLTVTDQSVTPGTPAGAELTTGALEVALPFYTALLGWQVQGTGDTVTAISRGLPVATLRPTHGESRWLASFAVDDQALAQRRAAIAGGGAPGHPAGSTLVDHAGCPYRVTTATSAPLPRGPGRIAWFEYLTTGPGSADAFYRSALGLRTHRPEGAPDEDYVLLLAGDTPVAGRLAMTPDLAAALPAGWMVYFTCPDVEAGSALAADLGGIVAVPPRDTPNGRVSALIDPTGAVCTLLQPPRTRR